MRTDVQYGPDRLPDVNHRLKEEDGYRIAVVRCVDCQEHWVRAVHELAIQHKRGLWLCPNGWRQPGCPYGRVFEVVNRPDVESVWRLTGRYGYGSDGAK